MATCVDCLYWRQLKNTTTAGLCVRFPPTGVPGAGGGWSTPQCPSTFWCGEFKQKPPGTPLLEGDPGP